MSETPSQTHEIDAYAAQQGRAHTSHVETTHAAQIADLARNPAGFRWDPDRAEYINRANGSIVAPERLRFEREKFMDWTRQNMDRHSRLLTEGHISLGEWQTRMRDEIRDSWRTAAMLGKGGRSQMTQADWGRLGGQLNREYAYLENFAADISTANLTEAQIAARARMYGNHVNKAYYTQSTFAKVEAGYIEERRVLNPAEHCEDCQTYASMGWMPIGTLPEPGEASACKANCQCSKEYRQ